MYRVFVNQAFFPPHRKKKIHIKIQYELEMAYSPSVQYIYYKG